MDILYLLIPVTLGLLTVAVGLFYWTVKSGQYDDLDSQAHRILFDNKDDELMTPPEVKIKKSNPNTDKTASDVTSNNDQ